MVAEEVKKVLLGHTQQPGNSVKKLASEAGVAFETARRAVNCIGDASLRSTNALLVAAGYRLTVAPIPEEEK